MIHKLVFDATDATTQAASSNVGAYLRASDGTLLTHTDVSGKKALDVNIAAGINVEVDLSHVDDSIKLGDGTDLFTSTTVGADIGLDVNLINASIAVTATQLDIDDLAFATDSVDVSGSVVALDAGTLAALENITVSATDLDIRDLVFATDKVDVSGSTVATTAAADTTLKNIAETVGVAAAVIVDGADELASRRKLYMYNNGNKTMYIGESGITVSTGFPVPPGSLLELSAGPAMDIFAIGDGAGLNMRTLQTA